MPELRSISAVSLVSAMLLAGNAFAKTLYVDSFGDDQGGGNTSCTKALPCASIQHALDNATPGSRVIVGPGHYVGSLTISMDRVKLISVAGARATTIEADGDNGVAVEAEKVSVGQKGKGFTITGTFADGDGVSVGGSRTRVEGNIIFYDSTDETDIVDGTDGVIDIDEPNAVIRYNTGYNFEYGIYSNIGSSRASRHLIADNVVHDIEEECLDLAVSTSAVGARDKVLGNHFSRCGYYDAGSDYSCIYVRAGINGRHTFSNNVLDGCGLNGFLVLNTGGEKSGDRYVNNVVKDTGRGAGSGYGFTIENGNPVISRNLVENAIYGIYIWGTDGAVIKDNLFQNIGDDALSTTLPAPLSTTFSGNTVENVGGFDGILYINVSEEPGTTPIKQMTRNNFTNYPATVEGFTLTGAGATNMADHGFATSKNFWGDLSSLDGLPPLEGNALTAVNDGHVTMNPSLKANPVKYKGGL